MTKQELRAECKALRASIPPAGKQKLDGLICRRIASSEVFRAADAVLLYVPVRGEIDLLPLVGLCRRQGKQVGFPVTDTETHTVSFRSPKPGAALIPGAYGIPEPPPESAECPVTEKTLCILPGLSFDRTGNRLGWGAGYYDRFLERFPGVTMGAVYEKLMREELPTEPHDRAVCWLVNERAVIRCRGAERGQRRAGSMPRSHAARTPADGAQAGAHGAVHASSQRAAGKAADRNRWAAALRRTAPYRYAAAASRRVVGILSEWLQPVRAALHRWLQPGAPGVRRGDGTAPAQDNTVHPLHAPPLLVLATFVFLILSRFIDGQLTRRGSEYISVILLQLLIFVLPAVLYIQLRGEYFPERIRMRPVRPEQLWFCFCALAVLVCGNLLISIMTGGIASLGGNFTLYNTFVAHINGSVWETVYVILAYAVLPAFCEELVYRSVLCAEYESAGVGVAVVVSSVFFAMLHFSLPLFLNCLFSGLLLAGVMYATRSTLGAMLLHLLYNLFCLFGQPYLSAFYVNAGSGEIFLFCLITLLLLFAAFGAGEARKIYHLYARANLSSSYTNPVRLREYPRRIARVLLTPAAAVVGGIWLAMSILALVR